MLTEAVKAYFKRMFPDGKPPLPESDAEFLETFSNFAFDEIAGELDDRTRFTAILSALMGCQGIEAFKSLLLPAIEFGVSPVEIKEIVYQGVVYLGMGRIFPFLSAVESVFSENGIEVSGEPRSQTTAIDRLDKGIEKQVEIFGEDKRDFYKSGSPYRQRIHYLVSENAYGEYYTRAGLDTRTRTMVTFCFLSAQGGCETQLKTHIQGNLNVGNDADFLVSVLIQILPFIGYPRTLNALSCLEEVLGV